MSAAWLRSRLARLPLRTALQLNRSMESGRAAASTSSLDRCSSVRGAAMQCSCRHSRCANGANKHEGKEKRCEKHCTPAAACTPPCGLLTSQCSSSECSLCSVSGRRVGGWRMRGRFSFALLPRPHAHAFSSVEVGSGLSLRRSVSGYCPVGCNKSGSKESAFGDQRCEKCHHGVSFHLRRAMPPLSQRDRSVALFLASKRRTRGTAG